MSWKALAAVLLAVAVAGGPDAAEAQETVVAGECCVSLMPPIGARALALGNALVARPVADALYVNPASIAALPRGEVRVHSERTDVTNATTMSLLLGLGAAGVVGLNYRLLDWGEVPNTNDAGETIGSARELDQMLGVSFATPIGSRVRAGVHYKLFQFRSDCTGTCGSNAMFSSTNHLADLGVQLDAPWVESLQLGASLVNMGPRMQVKNRDQADPPPTRLRLGAAYELLHHFRPDSAMQLIASADVNTGANEGVEAGASLGLELIMDRSMFVRTGYATGSGKGSGTSVGVGLIYDRFDMAVAKSFSFSQDGTEPFQVTFAVRF